MKNNSSFNYLAIFIYIVAGPEVLNVDEFIKKIHKTLGDDNTLTIYGKYIKVEYLNGTATLQGPVYSHYEKEKIQEHLAAQKNVSKVINNLSVIK